MKFHDISASAIRMKVAEGMEVSIAFYGIKRQKTIIRSAKNRDLKFNSNSFEV